MIEGLVSIIMPSFNTGAFIGKAIESVLNQTYTKWELIVVDDDSSDNTKEIVFSFKDDRIRYFQNDHNIGAAYSRNYALKQTKGEWIAFLDSDDVWKKEKLEHQIRFMKENDYDFSYSAYEKIDEKGNPLHVKVTGPHKVNKRMIYRYNYIGHLTMMYSFEKFGVMEIKNIPICNDYALRLKLFQKENTVCHYLDESLGYYRIRANSISSNSFLKKVKSHYTLFHYCDEKPALNSFILAFGNLFFGALKKLNYEKRV